MLLFFSYRIVLYCIYHGQTNLNKICLNQISYLPTEINQLIKTLHRLIISPLRRRERKSLIVFGMDAVGVGISGDSKVRFAFCLHSWMDFHQFYILNTLLGQPKGMIKFS